jgi:hypothetical protein
MSKQYPGGLITKTPVVPSGAYETSTASGIWTLDQQAAYAKLGQWPTAGNIQPDAQFNYVTMLLHGDGTNGAQNNTFLDSSTNNFTITRNGNTTQGSFSPYGSNWSNYFKTSDSIYFASNASYGVGTGNFTVEFWFSPSVFGSNQLRYFLLGQNGSTRIGIENDANGALNVYVGANSASITYNWTPNINEWYHIAVVRSGTTVTLYINGISVATATNSNSVVADTLFVGGLNWASGYGAQAYISNLRFTNTAVYTSAFSPSTTPLTAISGTLLLTCQSNRFLDNSSIGGTALNGNGTPSIQRFNPFGTSTAYSTSVIGGSGYFDGNGDYLTVPNNAAFKFGTGDYTIEFWLFYNAYGTFTTSIRTDGASPQWVLQSDSGVMDYYVNGSVILAESSAPSLSSWNHYAVVRNGSGTNNTKMYRNGVQVAQATNNTDIQPTSQVVIGSGGDSNIASFGLNGYLSNIRVVKGTAVYTSAFTPPTAPLTAISGTSLLTNFTNGAIFDNAMMNDLETVGNAQISTSVKKFGTGSIAFDGTEDYLSTLGNPLFAFGTGDFTIECWLNITTFNGGVVVDFRPTTTNGNYPLIYLNSSTLEFYASGATQIASGTLTTGTWFHFALSRSGSSMKMFINGTQAGSTYTASVNYSVGTLLGIGTSTYVLGSSILNGYIDEFRITKGYARYTTTFTPPTAAFPNIGPT